MSMAEILGYERCIVQKYLVEPLLYKGLKFDLRIYALVAGCDPLRVYIYNQGLVRFATQKYQYPNEENMDNLCMHLTNYAINKENPKYVFNNSFENLSYGHKKSLAEFFQTLKSLGLKANKYWSDIKDIIIKTLIAGQPHLQHEYRMAQPNNLGNNMCFQVLGFDFIIDSHDKVYLLQINHTPSFSTETPLDELIKSNVIRDTLVLMNINSQTRNQAVNQAKQIQQKRVFTGKTNRLTQEERQSQIQMLQQLRDEYQKKHLGSYQRIFPSRVKNKQEKYERLIQISKMTYNELTTGVKYRRSSPPKFRIKRISTNPNQGSIERQKTLQDRNRDRERSIKKIECSKSILVNSHTRVMSSPKNYSKRTLRENIVKNLVSSKKLGLKTDSQATTVFSGHSEYSQRPENNEIPISIHI